MNIPARIHQFPVLEDNYALMLFDTQETFCIAIDAPDADAINEELRQKGLRLTHILNTHHHHDHTGGNLALAASWGAEIIGAACDAQRIPGITRRIKEGEVLHFGPISLRAIATPGHTIGHFSYHCPELDVAFVGDTLFSLGCGRLFEGSPGQMRASLTKIAALPEKTTLYCAHEYTYANGCFARQIDPDNRALQRLFETICKKRRAGLATVPTLLADEKRCNPFLRTDQPDLQQRCGTPGDATACLAALRRAKDNFCAPPL